MQKEFPKGYVEVTFWYYKIKPEDYYFWAGNWGAVGKASGLVGLTLKKAIELHAGIKIATKLNKEYIPHNGEPDGHPVNKIQVPEGYELVTDSDYILSAGDKFGYYGQLNDTVEGLSGVTFQHMRKNYNNFILAKKIQLNKEGNMNWDGTEWKSDGKHDGNPCYAVDDGAIFAPEPAKPIKPKRAFAPIKEDKIEDLHIEEITKNHYVLKKGIRYYFNYGGSWDRLEGYENKTIHHIRKENAGIKIGMETPRFPTDKPFPYGY